MITKNKITKWLDAKSNFDHYKALEAELRCVIADELLEGQTVGTHTFNKLGYTIKAVKKVNITIDTKALEALYDDFSPDEAEAIAFKPSLVAKKYKALEDHDMIDHCLIAKPGMPALAISENEA